MSERCYLVENEVTASISLNDLLTEFSCCHGMKMGLGYRMVERNGDFVVGQETH